MILSIIYHAAPDRAFCFVGHLFALKLSDVLAAMRPTLRECQQVISGFLQPRYFCISLSA